VAVSFVWSAIRPPWTAERRRTRAEATAAGPGADRASTGEATAVPAADEPTAVPATDSATAVPAADGAAAVPALDRATDTPGAGEATAVRAADGATADPAADGATTVPGADEPTATPAAGEPTAVPALDGAMDTAGAGAAGADEAITGPGANGIPHRESRRTLAAALAPWAVVAGYLLGAVALTWRLWADPAGRAQVIASNGISHDIDLFAWFLRYTADAVSHGHLPALVTTALNAPRGINLMWNTSLILPAVLLTPVTLLAGPQVSLTILLTLAFAGSAAAMYVVLRRWGASVSAAALGGAVYGFSPALRMEAGGHYHLILLILPPLIIDALLGVLTGRGRAWLGGIWLGLLVAAQVYVSEEMLAQTAVAAVIVVLVLAASRPAKIPEHLKGAAVGLGCAVLVVLTACAYPLRVQFHGPLAEKGSPWKVIHFKNHPAEFVTPPGGLLFHNRHFGNVLANHPIAVGEYTAYLGWPLLVVLVLAAVIFWRDLRVRIAAVTCLLLEAFSLGGQAIALGGGGHFPAALLPWHYLMNLPVLNQMLANRFPLIGDGAAAAVLAFSLDRARAAVHYDWRRWAVAAVAVLAVVPLIPLPFQAGSVNPVPAGWTTVISRLHLGPNAPVLVVPESPPEMMRWQADTGQPGSLVGGYCIAPNPAGKAKSCRGGKSALSTYLNHLRGARKGLPWPTSAQVSTSLAKMRPAAILIVAHSGSRLERAALRLFGPPTAQVGDVHGWRR
jgi:hypothetical protein